MSEATGIGFLACAETLPAALGGAVQRRGDAFEHDLEVAALRPAFAQEGLDLIEIDWRAPLTDFEGMALVLLGTAWDYQDHAEEFITRLDALEGMGLKVCNSAQIVRWNSDKRYLRALAKADVSTIPTLWHDSISRREVVAALDHFECDRVIVKRQIGAGGIDQYSFTRESLPDAGWTMRRPAMIQPFLPAILDEGEYTFVFIDGAFSHAVRKRAAEGEYRIQSLFGGFEESYTPAPKDLAAAHAVIDALPFGDPLYARIDMIRLSSGELAVMEAEMIEPYLYPEQGPELGERLARAILRRM